MQTQPDDLPLGTRCGYRPAFGNLPDASLIENGYLRHQDFSKNA